MPTGYTAPVQDGSITEFRDFALQCARAFGATITMRDEPMDAPIPDEFKPSTEYHDGALERARRTLAEVRGMTPEQCEKEAAAQHRDALETRRQRREEQEVFRQRYAAMLAKVEAWGAPSPEHVKFRDFMLEQLRESIDFDCQDYGTDPAPMTGAEWREFQIKEALRSIEYHIEARQKEIERTESRNRWIRQLRQSLR